MVDKNYYLKPCPFCGSKAIMRKIKKAELEREVNEKVPEDLLIVGCTGSDCIVRIGRLIFSTNSEEFAARLWNRRVNECDEY